MRVTDSYIHLQNLRFRALHGVLEQERTVGGDYRLDLRMRYPLEKAMESDDVGDTLNYAEAYAIAKREMDIPSRLLEHVAARIVQALFNVYPLLEAIDLKLTKVTPPMGADCDGAGVELNVEREH